jgi:signal transduction histidine kinase
MTSVARAMRDVVSPRTWRATAQLVVELPAGIASFVAMVTLISLTFGLLVIVPAALVTAALAFASARLIGWFGRWRAKALLDLDIDAPHRPLPPKGWWARVKSQLFVASTWREVGYSLLALPVGVATFVVAVASWSIPITLLLLPATIWAMPDHAVYVWPGVQLHGWYAAGPAFVLGLVLLPLAAVVVGGAAAADGMMTRALLGPGRAERLDERVAELTERRARVVDAVEIDRRRLERDLHDGAQQRLVALAMDLGRAQEKFDTDPGAARALVADAHREAKQALVELRDLARGLHPAVLTDRGLDAALSGVAARSPVPVKLDVDVAERPSATIEGIAYFVVCEALTNVAKHASAHRAVVTVAQRGERLLVEITDDGHGGADASAGSGLAGLRDRVEGVDGWLHVSSPSGGPTTILVELPCAS